MSVLIFNSHNYNQFGKRGYFDNNFDGRNIRLATLIIHVLAACLLGIFNLYFSFSFLFSKAIMNRTINC